MKASARPRSAFDASTQWYVSRSCTLLTNNRDAPGSFALVDTLFRRGAEPPQHVHPLENELFYVREGEVYFVVDDVGTVLRADDALWIRKGVSHQFWLRTQTARCLLLYTSDPDTNVPAVLTALSAAGQFPTRTPASARHYPAAHYVCSTCR